MIRVERHGDVIRLRMSTGRSRFDDHAGNVGLLAQRQIPLDIPPASLAELRAGHAIRAYPRFTWGQPHPFTQSFTPSTRQRPMAAPTPGHAREHRVIWDAERETLFSGDLWLGMHVRLTHHDEDPRQLARDLHEAVAPRPARMFDAHCGPITDPVNALRAKVGWLEQTIGTIDRRIAQGWSDRAIVRHVPGGEELVGFISRGEYARANLVRNVRVSAVHAHEPVPTS